MRRRVVAREQLVVGLDGPEVEVGLPAEREQHAEQRAVHLLVQAVEAAEHRVASRLVRGEILLHERLERGGIAVFLAPQFRDLPDAALGARPDGLAVGGHESGSGPLAAPSSQAAGCATDVCATSASNKLRAAASGERMGMTRGVGVGRE